MEILRNIEYAEYEDFVAAHPNGGFMQSLRWANVKDNWEYACVGSRGAGGRLSGAMLVLFRRFPFGRTLAYAPRGPVCDYGDFAVLDDLLDGADFLAKQKHAYLFRCDPCAAADNAALAAYMAKRGFVRAADTTTTQVRCNYLLDLACRSEEALFAGFKQKCRYNIRLAERRGVVCEAVGPDRLDDFYALLAETGRRDGFTIRPRAYLERLLAELGPHAQLFLCEKDGRPLSGALMVQYGGRASYLYGASASEFRNLMPCYLMQWEMIRWAKRCGCSVYDFLGIRDYRDETSREYGVYRFKSGFRGRVAEYIGEFDLVYDPLYSAVAALGQRAVNEYRNLCLQLSGET